MKTLHVTIQNKIATYQKRDGDIVCGNSDYQIEFIFDSEWDAEEKKTARFIWNGDYYDQEFTGNTCPVPVIKNASKVEVGVYAGDLETTTSAEIGCLASILCKGGAPHPESGQHYTAEAVAAAEAAKASEDKAKVSETNAKQSESNASSYASTASVHASNAAKSATEAQNSENAAAESALNAFNSEVNAYVSEQKAKRVSEEIVARVDRNDKRITNLEQGIIPEPFETDSSVAYVKDVPENALPYAEIAKVGGMTRKCENLIPYPYVDTTKTVNGLTFTDNGDGSITVNGTAGSTAFFNLCKVDFGGYSMTPSAPSQSGYVISGFGNGVDLLYDIANGLTYLRVFAGKVIGKVTVYPMLNYGSTALPYEPYYEGLRDTAVTEIKSVGANLFDMSKWIDGASTTRATVERDNNSVTITPTSNDGYDVNHNYHIPIQAGKAYTFSFDRNNTNAGDCYVFVNDSTATGYAFVTQGKLLSFVAPYDATFCTVRFGVRNTGESIKYSNIMINEGATAIHCTPYIETSLAIPEAVQALDGYGLGINADCYNYINWETKTFVKRVGKVDMGTLSWTLRNDGNVLAPYFYASVSRMFIKYKGNYSTTVYPVLADRYITVARDINLFIDKCIAVDGRYGEVLEIQIKDSAYTDAATFKAAMTGVMLYYELETPEVTDITDLITPDNFIKVEGGGTITAVNEHSKAVPTEITYMLKEVAV